MTLSSWCLYRSDEVNMIAVPFDTLKFARKLESGGFSKEQANIAAEAFADAMAGGDLATKADIARVQSSLDRLENKIDTGLELTKKDLTIRLGGMMVFGFGLVIAAMRVSIGG